MSNVFTRQSSLPRTVTHSDFGFKSKHYVSDLKIGREFPRVHSPSRRANPQPLGLKYQPPYNRKLQHFGIWNPNPAFANEKRRESFAHLTKTNFSCRHDPELLANRVSSTETRTFSLPSLASSRSVSDTIQRESYQWPEDYPEEFRRNISCTRFGYSPKYPVVGIIPDAITNHRIPAEVPPEMTVDVFVQAEKQKKKLGLPIESKYLAQNLNKIQNN